MFSATYSEEVRKNATEMLTPGHFSVSVGRLNEAGSCVRQKVVKMGQYEKMANLLAILKRTALPRVDADGGFISYFAICNKSTTL
jgi:superfamily II DNA/RNA helicase